MEKHDIEHSGPGLRQAQKCGRDKPVNGNMLGNKQLNWCQYCKILQLQKCFHPKWANQKIVISVDNENLQSYWMVVNMD
jgi:hypothetical protein